LRVAIGVAIIRLMGIKGVPQTNGVSITFRLEAELAERLDHLAAHLSEKAGGVEVSRSAALRAALVHGIEMLESDKPAKKRR
jgi:predicted transcriptional regulator